MSPAIEQQIEISSDKIQLDITLIHQFLSNSYWAKGIDLARVEKSIENSLCVGVYLGKQQIGFARLITDYTTFGYLADVFVLPEYRGRGVAKQMIDWLLNQPEVQQLRRIVLATLDAHELYRPFGFSALGDDDVKKFMQLRPTNGAVNRG